MDDGSTPGERATEESGAGSGESAVDTARSSTTRSASVDPETEDLETLRAEVEEKYDFDDFGPADMARMSPEEWDASFDPDSWVTGIELLDRVEDELKSRIAGREVFAVLERVQQGGEQRVLAYSDAGYAMVYPDGTLEGRGTVLEDVKPTVALCSIPEYEPADPPENYALPAPEDVPEQSGELGNVMIQAVAGLQLLAGLVLVGAWLLTDLSTLVAPAMGIIFVGIALFLFATVANARLSDRFRAEEYRNRLRSVQLEEGERPDFVPIDTEPIRDRDRRRIRSDHDPDSDSGASAADRDGQ